MDILLVTITCSLFTSMFFLANDTMMIFSIHEFWVLSIFLQIRKKNVSCVQKNVSVQIITASMLGCVTRCSIAWAFPMVDQFYF